MKAITYNNVSGDFQSILESKGVDTYAKMRIRLPEGATNVIDTHTSQITHPVTASSINLLRNSDLSLITVLFEGKNYSFRTIDQQRFMAKTSLGRPFSWLADDKTQMYLEPAQAHLLASAIDDKMTSIFFQAEADKAAL